MLIHILKIALGAVIGNTARKTLFDPDIWAILLFA